MSALLSRLDREADTFLFDLLIRLFERAQAPLLGKSFPDKTEGGMVVFGTVDHAHSAFYDTDRFHKNLALIEMFGTSRFNANGTEWRHRRAITQPSYTNIARPQFVPTVNALYKRNIERIILDDPVNIQNLLLDATISIFNRAFTEESDPKNLTQIFARIRKMLKVLQYLSWAELTEPAYLESLNTEVSYFLEFLEAENTRDPAFAALFRQFDDQTGQIPHFRIASEYVMNAFAGAETTVTSILWAIDRLGALPEFQERLAAKDLETPEGEQALDTFINEVLRYFPPIPLVTRRLAEDYEHEGETIASGRTVIVSIIGLHHSPEYWNNPEEFDPERAEFSENTYNRQAFVPFAAGPRVCGGMRLARIEIREALKLFLKRFRITRQSDEIGFDYGLVLRPRAFDCWKLDYR